MKDIDDITKVKSYKTTDSENGQTIHQEGESNPVKIYGITHWKGGGAIKSINEKFQVNAANGIAGFSLPFPFSPSRNGFMLLLSLSYKSESGNGFFGSGWNKEALSILRKTEKKLPEYNEIDDLNTFMFSEAEDLVPYLKVGAPGNWTKDLVYCKIINATCHA